jgi:hypothetical protein
MLLAVCNGKAASYLEMSSFFMTFARWVLSFSGNFNGVKRLKEM